MSRLLSKSMDYLSTWHVFFITPLSTQIIHSKSVEFDQHLWCLTQNLWCLTQTPHLSQILTDFDKSVRIWLKFHRFQVVFSGGEWC